MPKRAASSEGEATQVPPKKRGRPPKTQTQTPAAWTEETAEEVAGGAAVAEASQAAAKAVAKAVAKRKREAKAAAKAAADAARAAARAQGANADDIGKFNSLH